MRESLLQLLRDYLPSPKEIVYKEKTIRFIEEHPDCFERSLEVGHITASAWLLSYNGTKALLMHHAKLKKWVQPGGHCDGNPNVLEVAIKEAQEESGIQKINAVSPSIFDLDIHEIPKTENFPAHLHYDIRFLLQVASDETAKQNHESTALLWVCEKNLPTQSPSILRMFHKQSNYLFAMRENIML